MKITDNNIDEIKHMYIDEHRSYQEIADYYNATISQVKNFLQSRQIKRRFAQSKLNQEQFDKIKDLYLGDKKYPVSKISKILNIKESIIRNYIFDNKLTRKETGDERRLTIPYETLYDLYIIKKLDKNEIQEKLNICRQTLNKNLKFYKLTDKYLNYTDDDICKMYEDDYKSLADINNITNFPKSKIRQILLTHNIVLRDHRLSQMAKSKAYFDYDMKSLNKQSLLKRRCYSYFKSRISTQIKKERNMCECCGSTENLHCHNIKPYSLIVNEIIKENNNLSDTELYNVITHDSRFLDKNNIKVVCEKCHYTIFHQYLHYHENRAAKPNNNQEGSTTIESIE